MTFEPLSSEQSEASQLTNSDRSLTTIASPTADPAARPAQRVARHSSHRRSEARGQVSVVIVEQRAVFRVGLSHFLVGSRFQTAANCSQLSEIAESKLARGLCVVLLGLDKDPVTVLSHLTTLKAAYKDLRIVGLAEQFSAEALLAAMEAGIDGYLLKDEISPEVLVASIELVLLGAVVLPRAFTRISSDHTLFRTRNEQRADIGANGHASVPGAVRIATEPDEIRRLSPREREILVRFMDGKANKVIARELNIAEATIKVHVKSLLRKLGVKNRTQAAMWATARFPEKLIQ